MAVSPRRYTEQEIDDFIGCPKVVSEPPKREMKLDRGHFRNDMRLKSSDDKLEFRVFIDRKSTRLNSSHANISYAVLCLKEVGVGVALDEPGHGGARSGGARWARGQA